jgi:nucleoside phosphorylase
MVEEGLQRPMKWDLNIEGDLIIASGGKIRTNLDFSNFIDERTKDFTGREWFFEEIDAWLGNPKASQFLILTGDPGIGKSAIIARLTQFSKGGTIPTKHYKHITKDFISAYHFCSARHGRWIAPEGFARSLSLQLAIRYPEFALALAASLKLDAKQVIGRNMSTVVGVMINDYLAESSEAIFDNLVRRPLNALCESNPPAAPLLIAVDGLDESLYYSGRPNITDLLASCHDISLSVRFLITSRIDEKVLRSFRPLQPYILSLIAESENNMKDIRTYLHQKFEGSKKLRFLAGGDEKVEGAIEHLTQRSRGNFLIISRLLNSIELKEIELKDLHDQPLDGPIGIDFLLVTPLPEDHDAVLKKLTGYKKLPPIENDIHTYFQAGVTATFSDGNIGMYQVIVLPLLGMGLLQAATATTTAIDRWHPRYIVVIGIAGGIAAKGVQIGDILIADQIVNYELQKFTPEDPEIRRDAHQVDQRLLNACNNLIDKKWKKLLQVERPGQGEPKRFNGPIASDDKVVAFGDFLKRTRETWPKLIGMEMEAAGVAEAVFQSSAGSGFFMVRCASDLADENKGSSDVKKWRHYACDVAASFAIALLSSGPVPLAKGDEEGGEITR